MPVYLIMQDGTVLIFLRLSLQSLSPRSSRGKILRERTSQLLGQNASQKQAQNSENIQITSQEDLCFKSPAKTATQFKENGRLRVFDDHDDNYDGNNSECEKEGHDSIRKCKRSAAKRIRHAAVISVEKYTQGTPNRTTITSENNANGDRSDWSVAQHEDEDEDGLHTPTSDDHTSRASPHTLAKGRQPQSGVSATVVDVSCARNLSKPSGNPIFVSPLPRYHNLDRLQRRARIRNMIEQAQLWKPQRNCDTVQIGDKSGTQCDMRGIIVPFHVTETKQATVLRHAVDVKVDKLSAFSVSSLEQQLQPVLQLYGTGECFRTSLLSSGCALTDAGLCDIVRKYCDAMQPTPLGNTSTDTSSGDNSTTMVKKYGHGVNAIKIFVRARPKRRLAAASIANVVLH